MKRLLDNLLQKNKYYNEFFKLTSGMIYDIQNGGREAEFEALVEKRTQTMKAVDVLDAEREKVILSFPKTEQAHIRNLIACRETPHNTQEQAVYNVAQENRKLLRKITTYTKNLDMQVKMLMSRMKAE